MFFKQKKKEADNSASFLITVIPESYIAISGIRVKFHWLVVLLSCKAF